mmetsp:Transcript_19256/g.43851  ORF Transcript_19256/g.43851 Transcript_19256/m.43851 type:complete len:251 (-) Transcript_19256:334-1086(-)
MGHQRSRRDQIYFGERKGVRLFQLRRRGPHRGRQEGNRLFKHLSGRPAQTRRCHCGLCLHVHGSGGLQRRGGARLGRGGGVLHRIPGKIPSLRAGRQTVPEFWHLRGGRGRGDRHRLRQLPPAGRVFGGPGPAAEGQLRVSPQKPAAHHGAHGGAPGPGPAEIRVQGRPAERHGEGKGGGSRLPGRNCSPHSSLRRGRGRGHQQQHGYRRVEHRLPRSEGGLGIDVRLSRHYLCRGRRADQRRYAGRLLF